MIQPLLDLFTSWYARRFQKSEIHILLCKFTFNVLNIKAGFPQNTSQPCSFTPLQLPPSFFICGYNSPMQKMAQHIQVEELWFKDGTVVFQAEHKLFCLHSGLVSARSKVFKQILKDKNSDSALEITRSIYQTGIPLIQLQDTAQDANNFFLAIYDIISG